MERETLKRIAEDAAADVRRAARSDHPPSWHRRRLDVFTAVAWRWVFVIVGILVAGGVAEWLK